jgi:KipI family sensor histidine kinase inhibitor
MTSSTESLVAGSPGNPLPPPLAAHPRLLSLGDSAWTLELGDHIGTEVHARVMSLATVLRQSASDLAATGIATITDVVPTFRSLTVHFDPWHSQATVLGEHLLALAEAPPASLASGRHWQLPVCIDAAFGPDLATLAQARQRSIDEVIEQWLGTPFRVQMIGFLPGFPYLSGWPASLAMPRLSTPRPRVPAHSVAVAGTMCGIYPWDSPGGWHLLGRTPLRLFDLGHADEPAWLAAGDTVNWTRVSRQEYDLLWQCSQHGTLDRKAFEGQKAVP